MFVFLLYDFFCDCKIFLEFCFVFIDIIFCKQLDSAISCSSSSCIFLLSQLTIALVCVVMLGWLIGLWLFFYRQTTVLYCTGWQ